MALPIGVTPVLEGKEAMEFLERIERDLKTPVGLTPTPKLDEAIKLIQDYGKNRQK